MVPMSVKIVTDPDPQHWLYSTPYRRYPIMKSCSVYRRMEDGRALPSEDLPSVLQGTQFRPVLYKNLPTVISFVMIT